MVRLRVDELGSSYFRDQGFDVSLVQCLRHVRDDADAVFLGGNGLRAARAIEEVERRTGLLVLESNRVLLWSILAATRTSWAVTGYGRHFRTGRSASG